MKGSFFAELKRRHVWRVAVAYAVTAWLLLQLSAIVLPSFDAPHWVLKVLIAIFVIFFPVALILAWAFEATPEGVRRTAPRESDEAQSEPARRQIVHRIDFVIIAVLTAAVGVLAWQLATRPTPPEVSAIVTSPTAATAIPAKSIAVLPFANLSSDKENDYFVAGMQDLILTKLADIGDLKVISRTSTMKYKSRPENLKQVADELGVATILEGSVQKQGNRVLITVQLIEAKSDTHLWAQSYQRTLDDIFGVEGEVAGKIAAALNATLSPAETAHLADKLTENPKAYNFFLRAEYQLNQGVARSDAALMKAALPLYRQAVAADPGFAVAWARLSYAESFTAFYGGGGLSVPKLEAAARSDAARAQALAPDATATQLAFGYVTYYGKADYAGALKAFRAALAQRPNDTSAMAAIGFIYRRLDRQVEAIAEFKRALVLDPRNAYLTFVLARTYVHTRRYGEALAPLQRAIALDPGNGFYRSEYVWAIVAGSGDLKRAWAAAQGDAPELKHMRIVLLTWLRKYDAAIGLLQSIPDRPDNYSYGSESLQLADLYRLAGDGAQARRLYDKARKAVQARPMDLSGDTLNLAWRRLVLANADLGLGERKAAFLAASETLELTARLKGSMHRHYLRFFVARLYAQAGRADLAVPLLAKLLAAPNGGETFAPILLRLIPRFDPIRHDPRFQALLKKYPAPATAPMSATR